MKLLKKSLLLIVSVIVIIGLLSSFTLLFPKRYNDGLSLKDISGDRSVLNGVSIKGVLSDDITQTAFQFSNNKWSKNFSMATGADARARNNYNNDLYVNSSIRPKTEIDDNAAVEKVIFNKEPNGNVNGEYRYNQGDVSYEIYGTNGILSGTIKSEVIYNGNIKVPFTIFPNGKEAKGMMSQDYNDSAYFMGKNGVVQLNDKKYLITITNSNCSGKGGVYDITDLLKGSNKDINFPNLAPVNLENGKIQITGMCASKDRLTYLIVKNRTVYMRPFNLKNHQFEKDIKVGPVPEDITIQWDENSSGPNDESEQINQPFIETAVFDDNICLAFFYPRISYGQDFFDGKYLSFYVVDIVSGRLKNAIVEQPLENIQVCFQNTIMMYKNDTLYILKRYAVIDPNINNTRLPQTKLSISAYRNSKSVYQGDIISSVQEDAKYQTVDYKTDAHLFSNDYYFLELN